MVTLGQMKAMIDAALAAGVPSNSEFKMKELAGNEVELQNKLKAYTADLEIYDSQSGVQVQNLSANKVFALQE